MSKHKIAHLSGVATSVVALLAVAAPAQAQSTFALEEITVTARKREESILDAPLSVAAFTGNALVERSIFDQNDLSLQTPGFDFTAPGGLSTARPVIRGMSQSSRAGSETNVATFIDGVYIDGFSGSSVFMDSLERVEILRGPQSAQYGRNSFAGAINYITKKPTMDFEAGVTGTIGEDSRFGASGYVNGAVVEDKLAVRIDAGYDDTGGYYKDAVSGEHLSARKTYFARAGVLANFSDVTSAILQVTYQDSHTNTFARNFIDPNDPNMFGRVWGGTAYRGLPTLYRGKLEVNPDEAFTYDPLAFAGDEEVLRANLTITADWDDVVLTSITGYEDRTFDTLADQDRTPDGTEFTLAPAGPGGGSPRFVTMQTLSGTKEKRESFSQELRLESKGNSFVNWAVGGYYSELQINEFRRQGGVLISERTTGPATVPNTIPVIVDGVIPVAEITDYETQFLSAFGSLDFNITDQLVLSGEGRYTWEDKSVNNTFLSAAANNEGSGLEMAKFKYFTPRVILTYTPQDDLTLYASVSKGTKSGGINAGVRALYEDPSNPLTEDDITFAPEKAWSYEIGTKFSAFDNRLRGAVAAYYVDWTNQQVSNTHRVAGRSLVAIQNAAKTEVKGAEVELTALLAEGLVGNVGYAYNDSKYKDAVFSAYNVEDADLYGFPGGDVSGHRLQNTSKHSFNAGLEYTMPAFDDYYATARADYVYRSKQFATPANVAWVPSYDTINLNLALENEWTRIGAFCNNVLNNKDASVGFNSRNINGEVVYQIQPREGRRCGLRLSLKMN
ncbi:MAG TPA: TonB-dependent receptor [Sphingomonadales bacterium]